MIRQIAHFLARPVLEAIADTSFEQRGEILLPVDAPAVHAVGPHADRILLVGASAVRGVGVASNQLGLGGHLARKISALTGRGVDLELAGATSLTVDRATAFDYDVSRFDAVILMLGAREAIGLMPVAQWRGELRALIAATSPVRRIFVVAIPDFSAHITMPRAIMKAVRVRLAAFNRESQALADELPGVEFVPFAPTVDPELRHFGTALYERWATAMAPAISSGLDPVLHALRPAEQFDEKTRQEALDALGVINTDTDKQFDRLARMARDLLGASGAAVTFLDHDRQWVKSAVSLDLADTERATSFCNTTISRSQLFVVEDVQQTDDFAEHPWVTGEQQVRFYAGYPLEAPDGVRVGALCVVDTKPRHFSDTEAALLRELALRVQALLWSKSKTSRSAS